jgi:hypothetical protein
MSRVTPPGLQSFIRLSKSLTSSPRAYEGLPRTGADAPRAGHIGARCWRCQQDAIAEDSHRKLIEIDPRNGAYHYNLGLFYKTRGQVRRRRDVKSD